MGKFNNDMDYEKYYYKKGDSYVIHFPNFNGYSSDEVRAMFSVYGNVLSIDNRKGKYGFCFIRYQNLIEVERCLHGFKNSKTIKILPHKHKLKSATTKDDTTNKDQITKIPSLCGIDEVSNKFDRDKQSDLSDWNKGGDSDNSSITSWSSLTQMQKLKQLKKGSSNSVVSSETSDNNLMKMVNSLNEDEIPSLTYDNKKTIVQAQEVIVANIHPNIGAQEILTLFKDYHPICVTFIKQVPDTEIRYCHAYFVSAKDALAIEKKFDKYLLSEHVLIVLRPQMLIEEAFFM